MVKRDVVQVITKGTRIDSNIDSKENNYIANIYDFSYCFGISYADVSTGEVYASLVEGDNDKVIKEIVRNGFKEVKAENIETFLSQLIWEQGGECKLQGP